MARKKNEAPHNHSAPVAAALTEWTPAQMRANEDETMRRLNRGRLRFMRRAPYAMPTLHGMVLVLTRRVPTMGVTDRLVLYINPDWFANEPTFFANYSNTTPGHSLTADESLAGVLMHEVSHIQRDMARLTALQQSPQEAPLVNLAADLAINDSMRTAGWTLPPWVAYPEKYGLPGGKMTEWYLQELRKKVEKMEEGLAEALAAMRQKGDEEGGNGESGVGNGCCGSVAGNSDGDAGADGKSPNGRGQSALERELDALHGRDHLEVERIKTQTAAQMAEHQAKSPGSIPGFAEMAIEFTRTKPTVDWEKILMHVTRRVAGMVRSGEVDVSYKQVNKRALALGTIRPGGICREISICTIRDTSGSMSNDMLNLVNNEIINILTKLGIENTTLVDGDVDAKNKPVVVNIRKLPNLAINGRGGTDFTRVLEDMGRLKMKFDVTFYLTDGCGPAPDIAPRWAGQLIWCIIPSSYSQPCSPAGLTVICSNDPAERQAIIHRGQR